MDIQDSPSGQIIKSPNGYRAFVPNPLPPVFEWDNVLVNTLSRTVTCWESSHGRGIAYSTAQRRVLKLKSIGIIQQVNDAKRDKLYCLHCV